jgi:hypothetical protein
MFWSIGATGCELIRSSQRQRNQVINFIVAGFVLRDSILGVGLSLKPCWHCSHLLPFLHSGERTRLERLRRMCRLVLVSDQEELAWPLRQEWIACDCTRLSTQRNKSNRVTFTGATFPDRATITLKAEVQRAAGRLFDQYHFS